ncbi:MAG: class I tRNA ligase family protein, partial [Patescibacteria group bacterium]
MLKKIKNFNLPEIEEKVLAFWEKNNIFEQSLELRRKGKPFRFFEGPPTANGLPGVHHALARAFKDIILRYRTMRGNYVLRRAGWDTHGLPVEIAVEKELGIKQKSEIEKLGIAEFNQRARLSVWRHKTEWERFTKRIGFWLDFEHPYITYENSYIESLWWIFKEIDQRELLTKL